MVGCSLVVQCRSLYDYECLPIASTEELNGAQHESLENDMQTRIIKSLTECNLKA